MIQLTRRDLLKTGGAAAAGLALASLPESVLARAPDSTPPPSGAWNHNPMSSIGPRHWDDIGFPTCGDGTTQSPVNIRTRRVAPARSAPLILRLRVLRARGREHRPRGGGADPGRRAEHSADRW